MAFPGGKDAVKLIPQDLFQVISRGHDAGIAHFGNLGLDLKTYADRIQVITRI
jgi:hypothetical protein